jgi:hypothetical protein
MDGLQHLVISRRCALTGLGIHGSRARSTAVQASPDSTASRALPAVGTTPSQTSPSIRRRGGAGTRRPEWLPVLVWHNAPMCTIVSIPESPTSHKAGAESGPRSCRYCTRISALHPRRHHRHVADLDPMLSTYTLFQTQLSPGLAELDIARPGLQLRHLRDPSGARVRLPEYTPHAWTVVSQYSAQVSFQVLVGVHANSQLRLFNTGLINESDQEQTHRLRSQLCCIVVRRRIPSQTSQTQVRGGKSNIRHRVSSQNLEP